MHILGCVLIFNPIYTAVVSRRFYSFQNKYSCFSVATLQCFTVNSNRIFLLETRKRTFVILDAYKFWMVLMIKTAAFKEEIIFDEHRSILSATLCPYGPVAQWIRRLPTEQEIPGSIPGRIGRNRIVN